MSVYNKVKVEQEAKGLEAGIVMRDASKSLIRYIARCKAIEKLYPNDLEAALFEMVTKNYRTGAPPSKSWIDLLKANNMTTYAVLMEKHFAPLQAPKATPPKIKSAKPQVAGTANPTLTPPVNAPPPAASPAATNLDELLRGVT